MDWLVWFGFMEYQPLLLCNSNNVNKVKLATVVEGDQKAP